jgi:hypothetical protein
VEVGSGGRDEENGGVREKRTGTKEGGQDGCEVQVRRLGNREEG